MALRDINVWAYHFNFGTLCRNAALDDGTGLSYPAGNSKGQAGWHVSIGFESLEDLAKKFKAGVALPPQFCGNWFEDCDPIRRGEVVRLALMAHGNEGGQWLANGKEKPAITPDNVALFHDALHEIGLYTREQGATILLMGCLAGKDSRGTQLLMLLSKIWPGRLIVGFSTIGYRHPGQMKRVGEPCELPGMRDTDAWGELDARNKLKKFEELWTNFAKMPWAYEMSSHAKVIRNGSLERCPDGEVCSSPPFPSITPMKNKNKPPRPAGIH